MADREAPGEKDDHLIDGRVPTYERMTDMEHRLDFNRMMKDMGLNPENPEDVTHAEKMSEEQDIRDLLNAAMKRNGLGEQIESCKTNGGGACYDELMQEVENGKKEITEEYYKQKEQHLKMHDDHHELGDKDHEDSEDEGVEHYNPNPKKSTAEDDELSPDEKLKKLETETSEAKQEYTSYMSKAVNDHDQAMVNAIPPLQESEKAYNKCLDLNKSIENFAVEHGIQFQCFDDMEKTYIQSTLLYDKITEKYKGNDEKTNIVIQQLHDIRDSFSEALQKYNAAKEAAEKALEKEATAYAKLTGPEQQRLYTQWQMREKALSDYKKQRP